MSLYQSWYLQPQLFGWKAHVSIHSFIQYISWVPAICQALFWKLRKNKWTLFLTYGNSTLWGNSKVTCFKSLPILISVCNVLSAGQPVSANVISFSCHVIFFLSADTRASYPHWETHEPWGLILQVPASPNIPLSPPILHFSPLVIGRWRSPTVLDWAFSCVLHQWPWPPLLSWTLIIPLSLWRRLKLLILIIFIWLCILFSLPPCLLVPPKPDFWKSNLPLFARVPSHLSTQCSLVSASSTPPWLFLLTCFHHSLVGGRLFWCTQPEWTTTSSQSVLPDFRGNLPSPFSYHFSHR